MKDYSARRLSVVLGIILFVISYTALLIMTLLEVNINNNFDKAQAPFIFMIFGMFMVAYPKQTVEVIDLFAKRQK